MKVDINKMMSTLKQSDAALIAAGLHDIAAAVREHTAAMTDPYEEPGNPDIPKQYLDGSRIDA